MRKPLASFAGTVGRFVRLVRDSHRFFIKESPAFVGRIEDGRWVMSCKARLFWPVAWMRFMWLMVHEGMRKPNAHPHGRAPARTVQGDVGLEDESNG